MPMPIPTPIHVPLHIHIPTPITSPTRMLVPAVAAAVAGGRRVWVCARCLGVRVGAAAYHAEVPLGSQQGRQVEWDSRMGKSNGPDAS